MADHIQIGDIAPRIQYTGDGTQTVFTYPFPVFKASDMEVYLDDIPQATGYAVDGAGESSGGDVTFSAAPASGALVTLRRRIAIQRTTDFQESGEFRAKVINDELDYLTAALQQVSDDGKRALRLGPTDPTGSLALPDKAQRSGLFLAFDDDGDPVASDASGPPGPQGPAGNMDGSNNLSELADVALARANLGLGQAAVESVAAGGAGGLLRADGDGSALTGITVSDSAARANIVLNAFRIAVQGGLSIQNMVDGVVDEFEDQTGVDDTASTDETYDASGDFYTNAGSSGNVVATATAAAYVAPFTREAASDAALLTNLRDADTASFDCGYFSGGGSLGLTWGSSQDFTEFRFYSKNHDGRVQDFYIESYNGSTWIKVAITGWPEGTAVRATDEATATNADGWKKVTFAAVSALGIRMVVNNCYNNGNTNGEVNEFEITVESDPTDMALISEAFTALAQPDEALIVVWQQDVDTVTLNTDLKAWASRDGGATWTQITLVEESSLSTGRVLVGSTDISGQPAGTSMKWKLETFNAKEMKIHGVGLEWS